MHLGPTNSSLTTHCEETLALSADGILTHLSLLLPPGSTLQAGPQELTHLLLPNPDAPLPDHGVFSPCPWVSVADLSPVLFRGYISRQMSCYTLVREWLLLYLSFCCFRNITPFVFTLNLHFGTLTQVKVVPFSEAGVTSHHPVSKSLQRRWIRSLRAKREISSPYFTISALPQRLPRFRLGYHQIRGEPANPGLD